MTWYRQKKRKGRSDGQKRVDDILKRVKELNLVDVGESKNSVTSIDDILHSKTNRYVTVRSIVPPPRVMRQIIIALYRMQGGDWSDYKSEQMTRALKEAARPKQMTHVLKLSSDGTSVLEYAGIDDDFSSCVPIDDPSALKAGALVTKDDVFKIAVTVANDLSGLTDYFRVTNIHELVNAYASKENADVEYVYDCVSHLVRQKNASFETLTEQQRLWWKTLHSVVSACAHL